MELPTARQRERTAITTGTRTDTGAGCGAAKDPVCGMNVDPHAARHTASARGTHLLLLLGRLPGQVHRRPRPYLSPQQARAEPVPEGTIYTCPMHPEIRQVGPGSCPICGMALEPAHGRAPRPVRTPNSST